MSGFRHTYKKCLLTGREECSIIILPSNGDADEIGKLQ